MSGPEAMKEDSLTNQTTTLNILGEPLRGFGEALSYRSFST